MSPNRSINSRPPESFPIKGVSGLEYDAEYCLVHYGTFTGSYNGDGLRTIKQIGPTKTYFLYDGTNLVAEYNGSGVETARNFWGANGLLLRQEGSQTIFFSFDPQGNVVSAIDYNSNELGSWAYDAYGSRTGDAPIGPYLYGGQWGYYTDWNTSTNLILCTHRYYDPNLGRWLTRDPIGYAGGINLYGYVEGNPVNWVDPDGAKRRKIRWPKPKLPEIKLPKIKWPTGQEVKNACKKTCDAVSTALPYAAPDPAGLLLGAFTDPNAPEACKGAAVGTCNVMRSKCMQDFDRFSNPPLSSKCQWSMYNCYQQYKDPMYNWLNWP